MGRPKDIGQADGERLERAVHRAAPSKSLRDQGRLSRCQRCSQDAHQWPGGKHPLSIALRRHIIIVTIVYTIRIRSTVRHIQALVPTAPDAERQRTCVSVSGQILAVSCGSPKMDRGEELCSPTTLQRADGSARVRRDHKSAVLLGEAEIVRSETSIGPSGCSHVIYQLYLPQVTREPLSWCTLGARPRCYIYLCVRSRSSRLLTQHKHRLLQAVAAYSNSRTDIQSCHVGDVFALSGIVVRVDPYTRA